MCYDCVEARHVPLLFWSGNPTAKQRRGNTHSHPPAPWHPDARPHVADVNRELAPARAGNQGCMHDGFEHTHTPTHTHKTRGDSAADFITKEERERKIKRQEERLGKAVCPGQAVGS